MNLFEIKNNINYNLRSNGNEFTLQKPNNNNNNNNLIIINNILNRTLHGGYEGMTFILSC
jgi:hypothetical protein